MNEETAYFAVMLRRFFTRFRTFTYRDVEIGKYVYYQFLANSLLRHWDLRWAKRNLPGIEEELAAAVDAEVHGWSDEPYVFDAHPNGIVLMRGIFGYFAAPYLPRERCYLLSTSRAEVAEMAHNRPDLLTRNIEDFFQPNPGEVARLCAECTRIVEAHPEDPILGSAVFRDWLLGYLPEVVMRLDTVQRLIEEENVGAVLTCSSIDPFGSALNLVARANRIPSITLQHGIIIDETLFCHLPVLAAKKAVWGPATRDWCLRYGTPPSRILVSGPPRFDAIANQPWGGRQKLRQILGLGPEWRIALHATEGLHGEETAKVTGAVIEGLREMEDLFLLILMHPGEPGRLDLYRRMASAHPHCRVERHGEIGLYDALSGADIFLACCSTSAMEAMLFQVPVVTVEPFTPIFSYGDLGACLRVRNADELCQVADRILNDEDFRQQAVAQSRPFLEQYCLPDGSSSARLMRAVEDLCHKEGVL